MLYQQVTGVVDPRRGGEMGPRVQNGRSETIFGYLKGTVSQDFLCPILFIKQLLLVPIGMPRNDFKFFLIFVELFVFAIDSPAMNTPGSRYNPFGLAVFANINHISLGS